MIGTWKSGANCAPRVCRGRRFDRGVEYGLIWSRLRRETVPFAETIHADLLASVGRAVGHVGAVVTVTHRPHVCAPTHCHPDNHPRRERWIDVVFSERPTA